MTRHPLFRLFAMFFLLAAAVLPAAAQDDGLVEGDHYFAIDPPVDRSGDKPEIVEVFNFTCPHCFRFSPVFEAWKEMNKDGYRAVSLPILWVGQSDVSVRAFYAAQAMGKQEVMKDLIFRAHFVDKQSIDDPQVMMRLAEKAALDVAQFKQYMESFGMQAKVASTERTRASFGVQSTPNLVVNGRYRLTPVNSNGDFQLLLDIAEKLAARP